MYIIVSLDKFEHSFSSHYIHSITTDLETATRVFNGVDRSTKATVDTTIPWNNDIPFEIYGFLNDDPHPMMTIVHE
jgi:hypothetical protein